MLFAIKRYLYFFITLILVTPRLSLGDCPQNFEKSFINGTSFPTEKLSSLSLFKRQEIQNLLRQKKYMEAAWSLHTEGLTDLAMTIERQLSSFLETAPILSIRDLDIGLTAPKLVEFEGSIIAVFKTDESRFSGVNYEIAAYQVDKLLKTHLVPLTTERTINEQRGSLQYFLGWPYQMSKNGVPSGDIQFFDWLIDNPDRHSKNFLVNTLSREQKAIDHGIAFNSHFPGKFVDKFSLSDMKEALTFSPHLYKNLQELTPQILKKNLMSLLSSEEIEALIRRRSEILEKMEEALAYEMDTTVFRGPEL